MPEIRADFILDVSEAESAVSSLADAIEAALTAGGETGVSAIESQISALEGAAIEVPVEADTTVAEAEVSSFVEQAEVPVDIPVEVDVSGVDEAIAQVDELASAGEGVSASMDTAGSSASSAGGSFDSAGASAGLLTGKMTGITSQASAFGGTAVAVLGLAGAFGVLFAEAVQGQGAVERFTSTTGRFATQMDNIQIGTVTQSISELALRVGSTDDALYNANATLFNFQRNAGQSGEASAQFATDVSRLAAFAVDLNPALGDVGVVAEGMGLKFGKAQILSKKYQLTIEQTEIDSRALAIAMEDGRTTATAADKAMAGVEIATARYRKEMNRLNEDSTNPIIQQRQLGAAIRELIEDMGRPLVAPILQILKDLLPLAETAATIVGGALSAAFVVLGPAMEAVGAVVGVLADGFSLINDSLGGELPVIVAALGVALWASSLGFTALAGAASAAAEGVIAFTAALATNPIGVLAVALGIAVAAIGIFGRSESTAKDETLDFASAIADSNGALDENAEKALKASFAHTGITAALANSTVKYGEVRDAVGTLSEGHVRLATEFGKTALAWTAASTGFAEGGTYKQVQAAADALSPSIGAVVRQLQEQGALTPQVAQALSGLALRTAEQANKQREATQAGTELALTTEKEATAFAQAGAAAKAYGDALAILAGGQPDLTASTIAYNEAVEKIGGAWFGAGGSIDLGTAAGRANVSSLLAATNAARDNATAIIAAGGSYDAAAGPLRNLAANIAEMGRQAGLGPAQIAALLGSVGLLTPAATKGVTDAASLVTAMGTIGPGAKAAADATQQAVEPIPRHIESAFAAGVNAIKSHAGDFGAEGKSTADKGAEGVRSGVEPIPGHATDAVQRAVSGVGGLGTPAYDAGASVGAQFARGIAGGIAGNTITIINAARTAIDLAVAAAKIRAGVKSPSTVFAKQVGLPIAQGIALGIEQGRTAIAQTITRLNADVLQLTKDGFSDQANAASVYAVSLAGSLAAAQAGLPGRTGTGFSGAFGVSRSAAQSVVGSPRNAFGGVWTNEGTTKPPKTTIHGGVNFHFPGVRNGDDAREAGREAGRGFQEGLAAQPALGRYLGGRS